MIASCISRRFTQGFVKLFGARSYAVQPAALNASNIRSREGHSLSLQVDLPLVKECPGYRPRILQVTYTCPGLPTLLLQLPATRTIEKLDPHPQEFIPIEAPSGFSNTEKLAGWKSIARGKRPHGMLVVRRKKMNKHKLKKSRKRNKFLLMRLEVKKVKRREGKLRDEIYEALTHAEEFDAEKHVRFLLDVYKTECKRQDGPSGKELFRDLVPDNVVHPWPNPYNRHDPANRIALDKKMAEVLKRKDPKKLYLYKNIVKAKA